MALDVATWPHRFETLIRNGLGTAADRDAVRLTTMGVVMCGGAVTWGLLSLSMGLYRAAVVPLVYLCVASLVWFRGLGRWPFSVSRDVLVGVSLLLPFVFQWVLGGIVSSGATMLWALLALCVSFVFTPPRETFRYLGAFLVLTLVSGAIDSRLAWLAVDIPTWLSTLFFVLNVLVMGLCLFVLSYWLRVTTDTQSQLMDELIRSNAVKSEFVSAVSHELRTPLTSVLGYNELSQMLLRKARKQEVDDGALGRLEEHLAVVASEGIRLSRIIDDILDFSKLQSASMRMHTEAVDLADIGAKALKASTPLFRDNVKVGLVLEDQGPHIVLADPQRITQVLTNLLGNAAKFTDEGRVTVNLCIRRDDDRDWVEVSVDDTGCGIPAEHQGRIFEKFVSLGDSDPNVSHGTGLGLAICAEIVQRHGGSLGVQSSLGEGASFSFLLPRARALGDMV